MGGSGPNVGSSVEHHRKAIARVNAAIAGLPPMTREIFLRHRIDDLAYDQIAAQLSLTVDDVQKHIADALDHLQREYQRASRPWWRRLLK